MSKEEIKMNKKDFGYNTDCCCLTDREINQILMKENQALKQQLEEKEKENEKLKVLVDAIDKLKQFSVDMEDYCLVDRKNADKIFCDNQDKIKFAIEQLEKVKSAIMRYAGAICGKDGSILIYSYVIRNNDFELYIDNQIKELKEIENGR